MIEESKIYIEWMRVSEWGSVSEGMIDLLIDWLINWLIVCVCEWVSELVSKIEWD